MMSGNGLTKLIEECGELVQICAKKLAYYDTDDHPDGNGSMEARISEEIADVLAAMAFVCDKFRLDDEMITNRVKDKLELFQQWDDSQDNITDSYDFCNINLRQALNTIKFNAENLSHISKINAELRKENADLRKSQE